jgi:hypothetical protein
VQRTPVDDNRTSPHILGTSANLLGFCLFVITALHITDQSARTHIDEGASIIALLLGLSALLSFFSMRGRHSGLALKLENAAEYLFILALIGIVVLILMIIFQKV